MGLPAPAAGLFAAFPLTLQILEFYLSDSIRSAKNSFLEDATADQF
jgi:hypothetical protein